MSQIEEANFLIVKTNGDRIPVESWLVLMWCKNEIEDPETAALFRDIKSIKGPWSELRGIQISNRSLENS